MPNENDYPLSKDDLMAMITGKPVKPPAVPKPSPSQVAAKGSGFSYNGIPMDSAADLFGDAHYGMAKKYEVKEKINAVQKHFKLNNIQLAEKAGVKVSDVSNTKAGSSSFAVKKAIFHAIDELLKAEGVKGPHPDSCPCVECAVGKFKAASVKWTAGGGKVEAEVISGAPEPHHPNCLCPDCFEAMPKVSVVVENDSKQAIEDAVGYGATVKKPVKNSVEEALSKLMGSGYEPKPDGNFSMTAADMEVMLKHYNNGNYAAVMLMAIQGTGMVGKQDAANMANHMETALLQSGFKSGVAEGKAVGYAEGHAVGLEKGKIAANDALFKEGHAVGLEKGKIAANEAEKKQKDALFKAYHDELADGKLPSALVNLFAAAGAEFVTLSSNHLLEVIETKLKKEVTEEMQAKFRKLFGIKLPGE
jgi:hypothetical protein